MAEDRLAFLFRFLFIIAAAGRNCADSCAGRIHGAFSDVACDIDSPFNDIAGNAYSSADDAATERQRGEEDERNSKETGHAGSFA